MEAKSDFGYDLLLRHRHPGPSLTVACQQASFFATMFNHYEACLLFMDVILNICQFDICVVQSVKLSCHAGLYKALPNLQSLVGAKREPRYRTLRFSQYFAVNTYPYSERVRGVIQPSSLLISSMCSQLKKLDLR